MRVDAPGLGQVHVLADQAPQARPLGQLQHRHQTLAGHEVRIIELGSNAMTHSRPPYALRTR